jgi:hypothetical protein
MASSDVVMIEWLVDERRLDDALGDLVSGARPGGRARGGLMRRQ